MKLALEKIGYDDLRREQAEARAEGKLYGVGLASFTEVVGAGPHKDYDILGLKMSDGAELRILPTGKAILKISVQTQGQGHETTFAQIVAEELGIQPEDVKVMHGDTDNTPYGLGTYASRSTPVSGAATSMVDRKVAVDDCGVRINPMIVEGQIHGGLTEGYGIAAMEQITFDEDGNCIGSNFMEYLLPTAWETPRFELGETVTPSPHHPFGAKGVGESATVGSPAAF